MGTKSLKHQALTLAGTAILCLMMYFWQTHQTAGTWFDPSNMPTMFNPRQVVAEIWCVCWLVLSTITGTGAGICWALSSTLEGFRKEH